MNDFYYRKLDVYNLAKDFVIKAYQLLRKYPEEERYALCDQLRRSVISIPSNIAEGMGRMAIKERLHFIDILNGSLYEVLCQLDISQALGYITENDLNKAEEIATHLSRVMSGLRKYLSDRDSPQN